MVIGVGEGDSYGVADAVEVGLGEGLGEGSGVEFAV